MDAATKFHLHDSLGYRLTYVARLSERRFEELLAPTGLTRLAWCALCAIAYEGLARPSDIAAFIGVDRTALSRILRRMERDGFVTRALDAADGRGRSVAVTPKGREAVAQGAAASRDNTAHFAAALTPDERETLDRILDRLIKAADAPLTGL